MTAPTALQQLRERLLKAQEEVLAHDAHWTRDRVRALPMDHWGETITIGEFVDRCPRKQKQYMGDWSRAIILPLVEHGVVWGMIVDEPETGSYVNEYAEQSLHHVWRRIR